MTKKNLVFRAWYYLRTGYSIYVGLTIAGINLLVTVYYLAIKSIPSLQVIFPDFATWTIIVTGSMVPITILIGWLHVKRTRAYSSEIDIQTEVNPYFYKLPPGYNKELLVPTYLELLRLTLKTLNKEPVTEEEKKRVMELQKGLENLIGGGYSGLPKGRTLPSMDEAERNE